jgi:2-oxoglutarate ferredoxin oxidoreductase subunit alpha
LWPFPAQAFRDAAKSAREIGVFELNGGQMIDDVRLSVLGLAPVVSLGGISSDESGFGVGPLLNTAIIRTILEEAYAKEAGK